MIAEPVFLSCYIYLSQSHFPTLASTCSAGIAPNGMVAKICSDQNKPNGQFRVTNSLEAVLAFVRPLPVRKIPGIGKRTEATLSMGFDIRTVEELYLRRNLLPFGFKHATLRHFAQVMWGHAGSFADASSSDREQKQMGLGLNVFKYISAST